MFYAVFVYYYLNFEIIFNVKPTFLRGYNFKGYVHSIDQIAKDGYFHTQTVHSQSLRGVPKTFALTPPQLHMKTCSMLKNNYNLSPLSIKVNIKLTKFGM